MTLTSTFVQGSELYDVCLGLFKRYTANVHPHAAAGEEVELTSLYVQTPDGRDFSIYGYFYPRKPAHFVLHECPNDVEADNGTWYSGDATSCDTRFRPVYKEKSYVTSPVDISLVDQLAGSLPCPAVNLYYAYRPAPDADTVAIILFVDNDLEPVYPLPVGPNLDEGPVYLPAAPCVYLRDGTTFQAVPDLWYPSARLYRKLEEAGQLTLLDSETASQPGRMFFALEPEGNGLVRGQVRLAGEPPSTGWPAPGIFRSLLAGPGKQLREMDLADNMRASTTHAKQLRQHIHALTTNS